MMWHARDQRLDLGARTWVMGIVNVTPDSFSGDGALVRRAQGKVPGLALALKLAHDGADILDVGGESSRPGAQRIGADEESRRVVPVIEAIIRKVKLPVSIDTYKPVVARRALEAGASIINLIKGTPPSSGILRLAARSGAGLVVMHMRGSARTMQSRTGYGDVVQDVRIALKKALADCAALGIKKESLVIDPGIGFAKTVGQNLELLRRLKELVVLGCPILVGTSRKSFIGKTLGVEVHDRLMGTAATVALAVASGANIVRVHDVRAVKQVVGMADAVLRAG